MKAAVHMATEQHTENRLKQFLHDSCSQTFIHSYWRKEGTDNLAMMVQLLFLAFWLKPLVSFPYNFK